MNDQSNRPATENEIKELHPDVVTFVRIPTVSAVSKNNTDHDTDEARLARHRATHATVHPDVVAARRELAASKNNVAQSYVSWSGGSEPLPLDKIGPFERKLVFALYDAQCAAFRCFWGREPDADVQATFVRRARYDAHATVRAGCSTQPTF